MRRGALIALSLLALSACSGSDDAAVELAEVTTGEVVRTIAAPASVEPRGRTTVSAEVLGEVSAILVEDGDRVEQGDPLVVLESPSLDLQIEQAQAAVDAAGALGQIQSGIDLSPIIGSVRGQLETVVPDLLDGLEAQIEALPEGRARHEALARLHAARTRYEESNDRLRDAEAQAKATAQRATASQRAAAQAQQKQAQVALDAARAQTDGLTVVAPTGGVIEFAREAPGAAPEAEALTGELGGLLGGLSGAAGGAGGPLAVGVGVSPGQVLATIFDLDGFHLSAQVDEIDAVLLADGQSATALIDALPRRAGAGTCRDRRCQLPGPRGPLQGPR